MGIFDIFKSKKKIRQEAYRRGASDIAAPLAGKLDQYGREIEHLATENERKWGEQASLNDDIINHLESHEGRINKHSKWIKGLFAISVITGIAVCFFGYAAYNNADATSEGTSIFLVVGEVISEKKDAIEAEKQAKIAAKEREDELKVKELELKMKEAEAQERETEVRLREVELEAEKQKTMCMGSARETIENDIDIENNDKTKSLTQTLSSTPTTSTTGNTIVDSGALNDNVTWELDDKGTLVISGKGDMDWGDTPTATSPIHGNVKKIIIEEGITNIKRVNEYFYEIEIPSTVTRVENGAFCNCSNVTVVELPQNIEYIGHGAFSLATYLEKVVIPNGDVTIESYAFDGCPDLVIYGPAGSGVEEYAKKYHYEFSAL